MLDTYLGNVEQNDSRKIYPAKAPRRKVKNIFRVLRTWRLCVFAGDMVFPISSSFPNFKYFWLDFGISKLVSKTTDWHYLISAGNSHGALPLLYRPLRLIAKYTWQPFKRIHRFRNNDLTH